MKKSRTQMIDSDLAFSLYKLGHDLSQKCLYFRCVEVAFRMSFYLSRFRGKFLIDPLHTLLHVESVVEVPKVPKVISHGIVDNFAIPGDLTIHGGKRRVSKTNGSGVTSTKTDNGSDLAAWIQLRCFSEHQLGGIIRPNIAINITLTTTDDSGFE